MAQVFDVVVVGGGTAGAITAARLSEDPTLSVCVLEAGPSDVGRDEVLRLSRWLELLESDYDWGYTTTLQPRGNAHIVHSRARVLGGCSSHNTQIWFKPLPLDWADWVAAGAEGWDYETMDPYHDRIPGPHGLVAEKDRNPFLLRLDRGRGEGRRRAGQPGLERRAVLRRRRLPRRRLRPGHGRALLVERHVPAPDHGRRGRTCRSSATRARCGWRSRAAGRPGV